MSLRDQFAPDLDRIFIQVDQFGEWREFRISNGQGGFIVFNAKVVWDEDSVATKPLVVSTGCFQGDVACFMKAADLPRAPLAGEIIYSPANSPHEVIKCIDAESLYELDLYAVRSQPAMYGHN